jgi:hypothetical protein
VPPGSGGTGLTPSSIVVSGTIDGSGPQILAHKRRVPAALRRTKALSFHNITVDATIYPSYAGSVPVTGTTTILPPSGSTYTASVSLSNVAAGNNEWIIMTFTGNATDGSQYALGELVGIVNVSGSSASSATLTTTTTQTAQILLTMVASGYLSTYDLTNTTGLASAIATGITNSHVAADPSTGLFDSGGVRTIVNALAPAYARTLVVSGNPEIAGNVTIVRDYTSTPELNTQSNLEIFALLIQQSLGLGIATADSFLNTLGGIAGGPGCGSFTLGVTQHTPPSGILIPIAVSACIIPFSETATTIKGVYGGAIILGVTTNPYVFSAPATTFKGGTLKVAGRAAGSASETVTTASTALSVVMTDPAGYAFGVASSPFQVIPSFGTTAYSNTTFEPPAGIGGDISRLTVPVPYSATSHTLTVDTFNPYALPTSDLALCGGFVLPGCFQLNAAQPFVPKRPFTDDGLHLSYFNWKASGGHATAVAADPTYGAYKVTMSTAGAATLTSTTATALVPRQVIVISNSLAAGLRWTLTAKDSLGNTYVGSALNAANGYGSTATIEMDSVFVDTAITSTVLTTTAGAGSFDFGPLAWQPSYLLARRYRERGAHPVVRPSLAAIGAGRRKLY